MLYFAWLVWYKAETHLLLCIFAIKPHEYLIMLCRPLPLSLSRSRLCMNILTILHASWFCWP